MCAEGNRYFLRLKLSRNIKRANGGSFARRGDVVRGKGDVLFYRPLGLRAC